MDLHPNLRLFADDTALYLTISTSSQSEILQKDLDNLKRWSHKWDMEFNPSKCQVIHITRSIIFLHSILFTFAYWNLYLQQTIFVLTSLQSTYLGMRT